MRKGRARRTQATRKGSRRRNLRVASTVTASTMTAIALACGPALGTVQARADEAVVSPTPDATTVVPEPASEPTPSPRALRQLARQARERRLRAAVVALARKQVGDRYVAGRAGPDAFDCSGLVRYVMGKVVGTWLPHYSRSQYRKVDRISRRLARPGDLVFYFQHGAHHVGIYIGGGRMIHAANPRAGVRIGSIGGPWYSRSFTGIGRLIPAA